MSCGVKSGLIFVTLKLLDKYLVLLIYLFIDCGLLILGRPMCYAVKVLHE